MADPDEALIEAIAEAMCATTQIGDLTIEMSDLSAEDQEGTRDLARAAYAALVEHLGLTEEHCCDHIDDDYRAYRCVEIGFQCISRLAQPWPERKEPQP